MSALASRPDISFDFKGRTAVVTGGAQGIGKEIANMFLDAGANVAVMDRDLDRLQEVWGSAGDRLTTQAVDVSDAPGVASVIEKVVAWSGSVDIAVNNAGVTRDAVVWKMTPEDWQSVLVHLGGTFAVTRAVVPFMRGNGHGRIINVTSYTGMHGNVGQANYAAAKGGIIAMTKAVAKEVARFGITVNAISPNAATAMVAAVSAERLAEMTATVPMGRFADPAEMAAAVGFLASAEAAYITGVVLPVDGGLSM